MKTQADLDQLTCAREGCEKKTTAAKAIWKDGEPVCSRFCFTKKFKYATPTAAPQIVLLQENK